MKKYPRMTLALTDEILTDLKALSDASGASVSSLVVDIINPMLPMIRETTAALLAIKSGNPDIAKESMQSLANLVDSMASDFNIESKALLESEGSSDD